MLNWANWGGGCCPFPLLYNLANLPTLAAGLGGGFLLPCYVPGLETLQPRGDARLGVMPSLGHHGWDPLAAPAAEISQSISPFLPRPQQI